MLSAEEIKKNVAVYAADFVEPGMRVGLGPGSRVYYLIEELGRRRAGGLEFSIVPTSAVTAELSKEAGIPVKELDAPLALTIDGADEIDNRGWLIKGGGGALLQEKIVAAASDELIIIADSSKLVDQLGKFPLPVEVIRFGYNLVIQKLEHTGFCKQIVLREKNNTPYLTDHGHYILDCSCQKIEDPSGLNIMLHLVPGVVETGLFIDMVTRSVIGNADGTVEIKRYGR